ncbi:hypothetical protein CBW42_10795 [Butyricicoccus porcorum]|uniref:DUF6472 domain-containing protein n=2 Tax=Butyricicoccaceae TaxID=3085642 RepID=A0A252F2Z9_9FIRM|nr:hypothetical protein CBW42_10795 [Butyricicoccus porcorum]
MGVPQVIIIFYLPRTKESDCFMSKCDDCMYFTYDEEFGYSVCEQDLDEDEMRHFIQDTFDNCPYYRPGDEYSIVRHQN